ncbi:MAG: hypothetical protein JW754_04480 [Candidatus Aenigmarchaeota archaeon]|nr:hypothetical protein [Candidatus Aenigmarchaeota archaeon]
MSEEVLIIPTQQARHISDKIRHDMECPGFEFTYVGGNMDGQDEFPDREIYAAVPEIEKIDGKHVVVLHGGAPRPNSSELRLFHTLRAINKPIDGGRDTRGRKFQKSLNVKPKTLNVFFTYFTGGKQDWVDRKGAINAAELYLDMCKRYFGVGHFFTIDGHFVLDKWAKKYPITNVSAIDLLVKAAIKDGFTGYDIYGPDEGSLRMGIDKKLDKVRVSVYKDILKNKPEELRAMIGGRKVYLVDDLLQTGGTLERGINSIWDAGAEDIIVGVTHLRQTQGYNRIRSNVSKLYSTDTNPGNPFANVSVSELVKDTIGDYFFNGKYKL